MEEGGGISFHYVPLIQCSFPHADPGDAHSFTRRNGWLELTLGTTRPETGLPYGVPARLLTIYAASEAVRTKSPEIFLGTSVQDFLRRLDVPITRGDRGSMRVYANQLLKLIHCTLTIDENIRDASGRTGLHIRQALFAEEARLWWDDARGVGQGSSLVLSSVLFHSILDRSAPLSTNAIKSLRKSPMDLDVYAWLVHRLVQSVEAEHRDLAAALRAVRPRLLGAAPLPSLLHRLAETCAVGLPGSEAQGRRRRRDPAAVAPAPLTHPRRCHQALNPQGATRSMRVTAVIRPSRDVRSPSWFRDETSLQNPLATEEGRAPVRRNRYISPALTEGTRARHARIWPKNSNFLESPEAPSGRPLHLSRFRSKLLIYMYCFERRKGCLEHHKALHLSRQSVARLPARRCISPAGALHLSGEVRFSLLKSITSRPLL